MNPKKNVIMLVGGGTGGHCTPLLSIYKEIKKRNSKTKIVIVGAGTKIEKHFFENLDLYLKIKTGKLKRYFSLSSIYELALIFIGLAQAFFILKKHTPRIIFSKGGYASVPILFWAKLLKIPYFIHESDAEFGFANNLAGKKAKRIFVGFPQKYYRTNFNEKLEYVGQFVADGYQTDDKKINLFKSERPTILVTGGSQGAATINQSITKALPNLLKNYNIIHQTGSSDFNRVKEIQNKLGDQEREQYLVREFFGPDDGEWSMKNAFLNSDLFIGRASITTPAEATAFKKPLILIPYPFAASDHQKKNAIILQKEKACIVINQEDLTEERLIQEIDGIMGNKQKIDSLVKNAKQILNQDALNYVTNAIIEETNL